MRIARPTKKGRIQTTARLERRVRRRVEQEAARFNASMSLVVTTALAAFFGIEDDDAYNQERKER